MPPRRPTPLDYPPSASSSSSEVVSDDELVASDEEVEEEEEEEEEMAVQKPAVEHESSDSDESDDSQLNSGTVKHVDPAAKPEEKVLVTIGKKRKKSESEDHFVSLLSKVNSGFGPIIRSGLSLIRKTKRVKMAKQWEKSLIDENKLMLKRLELHMETVKLVLDALRASSH